MAAALLAFAAVVLLRPAGWPPLICRLVPPRGLGALGSRSARLSASRVGRVALRSVLVVGACGVVVAGVAGPVAGLLATVCSAVLGEGLRARRAAAAALARRSAELELLSALAAELRAGRHPAAALAAVPAPADAGLESALAAARATAALGGDVGASLRRGATSSALAKLAAAWQLSEDCGAPLADLLAQVATDLRSTVELHRTADVELTGARATGLVLAVLPLLGVALGAAMGANPMKVLLHSSAGAGLVVAGLVFETAGLAWVRRLTNGARRCGE